MPDSPNPSPTQEIERFMGPISSSLKPEADGCWVKYGDHQRLLQVEVEKKEEAEEEARDLRARLLVAASKHQAAESMLSSLEAGLAQRIKRALELGEETAEAAMGAPQERQGDLVARAATGEAVRGACEQLLEQARRRSEWDPVRTQQDEQNRGEGE